MNSAFCQVHTPCPLGDDLARFLHLVEQIANRGNDYPAQLTALTLAGFSAARDSSENSSREIIRALQPGAAQNDQGARSAAEQREKLWQARLVLAIGELLDRQEQEIAHHLEILGAEETGLLRELQGEDEFSEAAELFTLQQAPQGVQPQLTHWGNIARRVAAWQKLYREADLLNRSLLLTASPDAADLLAIAYEKLSGRQPLTIAALPLPESIGDSEAEAYRTASRFTADNLDLLNNLNSLLSGLADHGEVQPEVLAKQLAAWQKLINAAFPEEQFGRRQLSILLFAGVSCPALLGAVAKEKTPAHTVVLVA
ncbi:MAG: hypothetical protein V2I32_03005, partial [Desulforhopalus sp.]|nr:hypothetical protein [Desulforhopalus sp.]